MKIQIIRDHATPEQLREMLEELATYIKLAVDVNRNILAGGGERGIVEWKLKTRIFGQRPKPLYADV